MLSFPWLVLWSRMVPPLNHAKQLLSRPAWHQVTRVPGCIRRLCCVVAEKAWGFFRLPRASPCSPVNPHRIFPFSVLLLLVTVAAKGEKMLTLVPVAFPESRGKASGYFYFYPCQELNTKPFQYCNLRDASWQQKLLTYPWY